MHTVDYQRDGTTGEATPATRAPARTTALPAPVTSWLQRVEAAAHPRPKLTAEVTDPKAVQFKFVYVMAPTSGGRHVAICLCKAKLRPNGEVASASPVSEVFSLLSAPPAYLEGVDEDLVRFFIAMRSGSSQGTSATEPKGKVGAILLEMLLAQTPGKTWPMAWSTPCRRARNGVPTWPGAMKAARPSWAGRSSRPRASTIRAPTRSTTCCRPIRRGTWTTCRAARWT
jgi:hypothetical protein